MQAPDRARHGRAVSITHAPDDKESGRYVDEAMASEHATVAEEEYLQTLFWPQEAKHGPPDRRRDAARILLEQFSRQQ